MIRFEWARWEFKLTICYFSKADFLIIDFIFPNANKKIAIFQFKNEAMAPRVDLEEKRWKLFLESDMEYFLIANYLQTITLNRILKRSYLNSRDLLLLFTEKDISPKNRSSSLDFQNQSNTKIL